MDLDALSAAASQRKAALSNGNNLRFALPQPQMQEQPGALMRFTVTVRFSVHGSHGSNVQFITGHSGARTADGRQGHVGGPGSEARRGAGAATSARSPIDARTLNTYMYAGSGGAEVPDFASGAMTGAHAAWYPCVLAPHAATKLHMSVAALWNGTPLPRNMLSVVGSGTLLPHRGAAAHCWEFVTPHPVSPWAVTLLAGPWHSMSGAQHQRMKEAVGMAAELLTPYAAGPLLRNNTLEGPLFASVAPIGGGGETPKPEAPTVTAAGMGNSTTNLTLGTSVTLQHYMCAVGRRADSGEPIFPPLHTLAVMSSPLQPRIDYKHGIKFLEQWLGFPMPSAAYRQVLLPALATRGGVSPYQAGPAPAGDGAHTTAHQGAVEYMAFPGGAALPASLLASARWPDAAVDVRRVMVAAMAGSWFGAGGVLAPASWRDEWIMVGLQGWLSLLYVRKLVSEDEYRIRIMGMAQAAAALEEQHQDLMPLCPLPVHGSGEPMDDAHIPEPSGSNAAVRSKLVALKATLVFHALAQLMDESKLQQGIQTLLLDAANARGMLAMHQARAAAGAAPVRWTVQDLTLPAYREMPPCGTQRAQAALSPVGAIPEQWAGSDLAKSGANASLLQVGLAAPSTQEVAAERAALAAGNKPPASGAPPFLWCMPQQAASGGSTDAAAAASGPVADELKREGVTQVQPAYVVSTARLLDTLLLIGGAGAEKTLTNYFRTWVYGRGAGAVQGAFFFNRRQNEVDLVLQQTPARGSPFIPLPLTVFVQEEKGAYEHMFTARTSRSIESVECHSKKRQHYERGLMEKRTGRSYSVNKKITEYDRDGMNDTPVHWVRLDSKFLWVRRAVILQPPLLWYTQVMKDPDTTGKLEAVQGLATVLSKCYPKPKSKAEMGTISRSDIDEIGTGSEWYYRGISVHMQERLAKRLSGVVLDNRGKFHPSVRAAAAAAMAQWQTWRHPPIGRAPYALRHVMHGLGQLLLGYGTLFFSPAQQRFAPMGTMPNAAAAVRATLLAAVYGGRAARGVLGAGDTTAVEAGTIVVSTARANAAGDLTMAARRIMGHLGVVASASVVTAVQTALAEHLRDGDTLGPLGGAPTSVHSHKGQLRAMLMGGRGGGKGDDGAAGDEDDTSLTERVHSSVAAALGTRLGEATARTQLQRSLVSAIGSVRSLDGVTPPICLRFLLGVAGDVRGEDWIRADRPSMEASVDTALLTPVALADRWLRVAAGSAAGVALNGCGHAIPVMHNTEPALASLLASLATAAADSTLVKVPSLAAAATAKECQPVQLGAYESTLRWEDVVASGGQGMLPAGQHSKAEESAPSGLPPAGHHGDAASAWVAWRYPASDVACVARLAHAVLHRLTALYTAAGNTGAADCTPGATRASDDTANISSWEEVSQVPDSVLLSWLSQEPALAGALLCAAVFAVGVLDAASVAPMPEETLLVLAAGGGPGSALPPRVRVAAWAALWDARVAPAVLQPPPPPTAFSHVSYRHRGPSGTVPVADTSLDGSLPAEGRPVVQVAVAPAADGAALPADKVPVPSTEALVAWASDTRVATWYSWLRWLLSACVGSAGGNPAVSSAMLQHALGRVDLSDGAYGVPGVDDADANVAPGIGDELLKEAAASTTSLKRFQESLTQHSALRAKARAAAAAAAAAGAAADGGPSEATPASAFAPPEAMPVDEGLGMAADHWMPAPLRRLWGSAAQRPSRRGCLLPLGDPSFAAALLAAAGERVVVQPSASGQYAIHAAVAPAADSVAAQAATNALSDARTAVQVLWGALTVYSPVADAPALSSMVQRLWHGCFGRFTPAWVWGEGGVQRSAATDSQGLVGALRLSALAAGRQRFLVALSAIRAMRLAEAQYAHLIDGLADAGKMPDRPRVRNTFEIDEDEAELGATHEEANAARDRLAMENAAAGREGGASAGTAVQPSAVGGGMAYLEEDDDDDDEDEEFKTGADMGFGEMLQASTAAAAAGGSGAADAEWKRRKQQEHQDVGDAVSGLLSGDMEEATL